ncbi:PAS domain S-box protein [Pelobacter propionicus]|uniref:histidine kinase n=1 Tax=Pelobacter propionicus (strain DSM 2379 / NBRC 103807 / OttBd1) TaxID=338966 RepID=A1AN42_PELPD|nr:PAS domain S-box protein [Pelobacter propionicus]ABK98762.1 PAS/PAC sensor hybrid histidine kinase [Pelobacter propionicus DSM 2379]
MMKNTTRFMLFNVLLVALALATAAAMFLAEIYQESRQSAINDQEQHLQTFWELLRSKGEDIRIVGGKLMAGTYVVNNNYELPDKMNQIFGCTATVFMGDTRVSTNVLRPDSSRATNTRLQGAPYDAIFREGKPYRGEALILGQTYLTAYDPIRNARGEVIGALYVGIKESTFFKTYEQLRYKVIAVTTLLMCIFSLLAALLVRFRRQAVEVLKESERKYRQLFEVQSDAILMIDGETCDILEANASAIQLYGFGREEFLKRKSFELSADSPQTCMPLQELKRHTPLSLQRKKDGTVFPVEIFTSRYTWKQKAMQIAVIRDITERTQAEEALQENRERLQLQFDHMPIACIAWGTDYSIQSWNPAAEKVFGYTAQEAIGKSANDLIVPPEIQDEVNAVWQRLLENDETVHCTHQNMTKGRQKIFCKWTKTPLRDIRGNIIGFISMAEDITQLRNTDQALRETVREYQDLALKLDEKQNFLATLMDSIPDLIFYKDSERRYLGCNKAFESFAGRTEEELVGCTDFDLFGHDVGAFFRERDLQVMAQNLARQNEEWVDYPDGRHILLDTLKTPFHDHQGRSLGLIGISRDITERHRADTERKNLEGQLYQSQKMEAIGQLAGGVAHDFNNILTVIIGYAEILLLSMEREHALRYHVEQVLTAAGRAAELTAGLLAFSRKQLLHMKQLDLGEVARGLRKMLRRLIPEDIDFKTIIVEKELTILADKGQIEQVIMNLVTNAKDAMPKGGSLTLEIAPATMDEQFLQQHGFGEPGGYACITIADTGHGMDEETRKRLFEPFFTTKEAGKGTGLGTAIIYGIVKQHNGFISVDSEPGRGSTFSIYLPLIAATEQDAEELQENGPPPGGTETILLAEDDITVRELHSMILEEAGYHVIRSSDGQEALDKFMEHQSEVAMLVSDVIMPKIDGKRLYEEIRKIRPDMKVLLISGYTSDIFVERGIMEDEYGFMAKPVVPSELLRQVRSILDNN